MVSGIMLNILKTIATVAKKINKPFKIWGLCLKLFFLQITGCDFIGIQEPF